MAINRLHQFPFGFQRVFIHIEKETKEPLLRYLLTYSLRLRTPKYLFLFLENQQRPVRESNFKSLSYYF